MNPIDAIAAMSGHAGLQAIAGAAPCNTLQQTSTESFGELLSHGLEDMEAKVDRANELVRAFAVDDSIPIHEVTIALEEARLAVELAVQVRTRVVEGYREIMNMQL